MCANFRFFSWSVSYPTAAHFIGYYNANNSFQQQQQQQQQQEEEEDCSDDTLYFPADIETDFLDDITMVDLNPAETFSELEGSLIDVELNLPGMECGQRDAVSLQFQLEELTSSLLEKALQGKMFRVASGVTHYIPSRKKQKVLGLVFKLVVQG